jgi:diaminopimelate decarboxylase
VTAPIDLGLLPRSAELAAGRLSIGGCDLEELADRLGTPLVVYDEDELRARCSEYRGCFGDDAVAYAGKAFLCIAMARLVQEERLHLDVATGGELHTARRAGFPPGRLLFHGNNKSDEELRFALDEGVGRIVVDSFDEIDRIERLVDDGLNPPHVLIRVTPGVEAHTHAYIETGTDDSKFGFGVDAGVALEAALRVAGSPAMQLAGIHCHIGSQVWNLTSYARALRVVADVAARAGEHIGTPIGELNIGGGLGIAYHSGDAAPTIAEYAGSLQQAFKDACVDAGLDPAPRLMVEPGRSIAGPSGLTLYRVGTIKHIPSVRTYVAVDGGMSDNPRPVTYGARYEAFVPARADAERPFVATVAGKHCEQGDLLARDASLPADVVVGDVLAMPATGAYGYSMASNYNRVPRPAVVFVRDGQARVVVRRETLDDLVRLDES